ncbi:MAG TPA: hypothetical protein VG323_15215 [Thermoanaerobaculia bacterium]|nr:hypothetical protein [Thermoanaerobaculia bacterium]
MRFRDRDEAGELLGRELARRKAVAPVWLDHETLSELLRRLRAGRAVLACTDDRGCRHLRAPPAGRARPARGHEPRECSIRGPSSSRTSSGAGQVWGEPRRATTTPANAL